MRRRNLHRNGCRPGRFPASLDVDFHPISLPTLGRADTVHGRGTLNALGMRLVEEHEGLAALRDLLDLLTQQTSILNDRLVGLAEMLARAILDRAHRFHGPLVVHVDVVAPAT